jgi:hypothetical protein
LPLPEAERIAAAVVVVDELELELEEEDDDELALGEEPLGAVEPKEKVDVVVPTAERWGRNWLRGIHSGHCFGGCAFVFLQTRQNVGAAPLDEVLAVVFVGVEDTALLAME